MCFQNDISVCGHMVDNIDDLSLVDIPFIRSDEPPLTMDEVMELRKFGAHRSPCAKCKHIMQDKNGMPCNDCAKVAEYNKLEGKTYV